MRHFRYFLLIAASALMGAPATSAIVNSLRLPSQMGTMPGAVPLSVMTYNVKGLPWPVASGRPAAITEIGSRLRAMRGAGVQPNLVMLQEGFSEEARKLGTFADYRYVAFGPDTAPEMARPPLGMAFAAHEQRLKGEGVGSLLNSGLVILSDYPIIRTARYAFPAGACAGFDCLAAKGALVAWVDVPGAGRPVAVVDVHLNARKATMVSIGRADAAYFWQVASVRRFLGRVVSADTPVIFAGDLNIGIYGDRTAAFSAPIIGSGQREVLPEVLAEGKVPLPSLREALGVVERNKDKIFARNAGGIALTPQRAWVPFGVANTASPLSDHAGFVVDFTLSKARQRAG